MGLVVETILAAKANLTGGAFENLNPGTNDVFTVRAFVPGSYAAIDEVFGLDDDNACQLSIASPRMNDGQFGLRLALPSSVGFTPPEEPEELFIGPATLPVYPSDTLRIRADGTAADDVAFGLTLRYENLDASDVPLRSWANVGPNIEKIFGILVQPTAGTCDYGAAVTLDSVDDRLEADKLYAYLGATSSVPAAVLALEGPDTGRYRIGMPLKTSPVSGADYFPRLSAKYGVPYIPVIKAVNKGSTLISAVQTGSADTIDVTLILAQLSA
jgi:hypothetical protein